MIDLNKIDNAGIEKHLSAALVELLATARLCGLELVEMLSRRMITIGAAGYEEAMGAEKAAESFYRMADQLAVEKLSR